MGGRGGNAEHVGLRRAPPCMARRMSLLATWPHSQRGLGLIRGCSGWMDGCRRRSRIQVQDPNVVVLLFLLALE
eukprot:scaffold4036_cov115-Isochrysis_galbana.AAC.3